MARGNPLNYEECESAYIKWWREWLNEQCLWPIINEATGVSDMFGQIGHICQATVLWKLRNGEL